MKFNLENLPIAGILLILTVLFFHSYSPTAQLSPPDQSGISVAYASVGDMSFVDHTDGVKMIDDADDFWQPPTHDASMQGVGTDDDPLGVDHSKYVAVLTQASTSAPTAVVVDNELTGNGAYSYTSTGIYVWEVNSAQLTANKTFVTASVGNATGLVAHAYSITDSTVVIKVFDAAGAAANLAGTMYLEVDVYP